MRNAIILAIVLVVALLLRAYVVGPSWWIGIDDANIYYVFVRNILNGHGVVYTPGGELVEGFTSPLWLALLVLFSTGNVLSVEAASLVLGLVFTFATLWLAAGAVRRQRGSVASWFVIVAILATPGVVDWMLMARLETPLWMLALTVAGLRMAYGPYDRWFYIALGLLPLIRPEGFVLGPLIAVAACYARYGATRAFIRPALLCATIPITIALFLTLTRYMVFGMPLPNTYYAKVSSSMVDNIIAGLYYSVKSAMHTMWVPIVVFAVVMIRVSARKERTLGVLVAVILMLPLLTGGDHFAYARFQIPAIVFIWVLAGRAYAFTGYRIVFAALALLVMNISLPYLLLDRGRPFHAIDSGLGNEYWVAREGRMQANAIEYIHQGGPLPRWGVISAGGTAFEYSGECIDLLGLSNPRMARANRRKTGPVHGHSSFNAEVFFEQRPDILYLFSAANDSMALVRYHTDWDLSTAFVRIVHANIVANPRFKLEYGLTRLTSNGVSIYGLVRRDWMLKAPTVSFAFLQ